ncbi:MAG TPA: nucleotide pyrophosphohydrolase [Desulfobulbus sp.]|nr:nucleotide pyrophosphohydrolase [Desulfobulbus sp.]
MTQPHRLSRLEEIIQQLRSENGCPWDKKQTPASIKKYLIEESRELAEAIDNGEPQHIREEIGDLFFILTILCEMFREKDIFTTEDALQTIIDKMIRRHPHVFNGAPTGTDQELRRQWQAIKEMEKTEKK